MSCVIGLVDNEGQIWMGSDNFATTDKGEIRPIKVQKIFRNGKYLFGYTGSVRGGQILTSKHFTPPKDIDYLTMLTRRKPVVLTIRMNSKSSMIII